jgi:hypothetical protein
MDVEDPSLDGVVISQDPEGATEAEPNAVVTIIVGRLLEPEPPPPTVTGPPPDTTTP